jgi:hypothetical protein
LDDDIEDHIERFRRPFVGVDDTAMKRLLDERLGHETEEKTGEVCDAVDGGAIEGLTMIREACAAANEAMTMVRDGLEIIHEASVRGQEGLGEVIQEITGVIERLNARFDEPRRRTASKRRKQP